MRRQKVNKRISLLLLFSASVHCYEVETHGLLTKNAFDFSVMGLRNSASVDQYRRLGFDRVDPNDPSEQIGLASCQSTGDDPKQDAYIDALPEWLSTVAPDAGNRKFRCIQAYEHGSFPPAYRGLVDDPQFGSVTAVRLEAWVMRGVIREDDLKADKYTTAVRPDADPWGDKDRPVNHFYVPVSNQEGTPLNFGERALDWAMGEITPLQAQVVPDPSRGNHFSYIDARRNYFQALTYRQPGEASVGKATVDSAVRQNLWASTMLSLGHIIHLLQDQASPQHARAEAHNYVCRGVLSLFNEDVATRTYENFINFRVMRANFEIAAPSPPGRPNYVGTNPCEEERWIKMFEASGQTSPPALTSWLRPGNAYPVPQFAVQRKFFTTRSNDGANIGSTSLATLNARAGLGDYSNRGFYTEGKMQGNLLFPFISPPRQSNDASFTDGEIGSVIVPGKGKVKFKALFWQVPDAVAPTFADAGLNAQGKAPIVSYGQWGFLGGFGVKRRILTLANYNQMADMLAPRAIAYSTGLINFFFRGKIAVEAPLDGLIAAMDHGIAHNVVDGFPRCTVTVNTPENWCTVGRVYGFTKIRLKIRNDTASITESGSGDVVAQDMVSTVSSPSTASNAGLYAVARYHRNPCYQPDLSGERRVDSLGVITEPAGCLNARTDVQEISVSKPKVLSASELNNSSAQPVSFDFSEDPIPINATDLILQVVYRGQLGAETDGIAVGSIDVKEPSYLTYWNNSDYGGCNGQWFASTLPAGCGGLGVTFAVPNPSNLCLGSQLLLSHTTSLHGALQVGRYLRVGVLVDDRIITSRARSAVTGLGTVIRNRAFAGQRRQSDREIPTASFPYVSEPFYSKRGLVGSFSPQPFYKLHAADPQPLSDSGPLDVGTLTPVLVTTQLPFAGEFTFPDVGVSNPACPTPSP
jgi:hypothetical protein